jgi:CBS domain-containing protein
MSPPITMIESGAHLAAAVYLIRRFRASALVVTTDDTYEPVAIITDAEITRAVADGRDLECTRISQMVGQRPLAVDTDVAAADAARLMLAAGTQQLPVMDGKRLVGTVHLADLCRALRDAGPLPAAPDAP